MASANPTSAGHALSGGFAVAAAQRYSISIADLQIQRPQPIEPDAGIPNKKPA